MKTRKVTSSLVVLSALAFATSCGSLTPQSSPAGATRARTDGPGAHVQSRFALLTPVEVCPPVCNGAFGIGHFGRENAAPYSFNVVDSTTGDLGFFFIDFNSTTYRATNPTVVISGNVVNISGTAVDDNSPATVQFAYSVTVVDATTFVVTTFTIDSTSYPATAAEVVIIEGACEVAR